MSWFDKIADIATGGLAKEAFGLVKSYFPPSMSDSEKQEVMLKLEALEVEKKKMANDALNEAEQNFNKRLAEHEGTASDLKVIPFIGPIIIFLRGLQRPIWGFAVLYMDFNVFSGVWVLVEGQQETAFFIINFLVLGFLFGERALKNLMPLVNSFMAAKK